MSPGRAAFFRVVSSSAGEWGLIAQFPAPLKSRGCATRFSARSPVTFQARRAVFFQARRGLVF